MNISNTKSFIKSSFRLGIQLGKGSVDHPNWKNQFGFSLDLRGTQVRYPSLQLHQSRAWNRNPGFCGDVHRSKLSGSSTINSVLEAGKDLIAESAAAWVARADCSHCRSLTVPWWSSSQREDPPLQLDLKPRLPLHFGGFPLNYALVSCWGLLNYWSIVDRWSFLCVDTKICSNQYILPSIMLIHTFYLFVIIEIYFCIWMNRKQWSKYPATSTKVAGKALPNEKGKLQEPICGRNGWKN